jgi:dephospho-CoA kinase
MNKIVVGLTGGIGSGKSAAAEVFCACGFALVDADILSREAVEKGSAGYAEMLKLFPDAFCEGVLDRSKLRERVFGSKSDLELLNSVTHPIIIKRAREEIESRPSERVIFAAPLLFETGGEKLCNVTVTVACKKELRIQRIMKRDNISRETAEKIIAAQLTDRERRKKADYVLYNEKGFSELRDGVEKLIAVITGLRNGVVNRK